MALTEKRIQLTESALRKPVTPKSSKRNLIACGVLTEDGNVAQPYQKVVIKKK